MSSSHFEDLRALHRLYHGKIGDVDESLSPGDEMWDDEQHYRNVGESAVRIVRLAMLAGNRQPEDFREVLDLPCGHGRVLRYLREVLPDARITACDILRDGVDFCAKSFGATPVYGAPDPRTVELPYKYDLIWVGSLFTHLDAPRWRIFLDYFASALADEGILIFTTQGRQMTRQVGRGWNFGLDDAHMQDLARQYRAAGFGYVDYPGQTGYGISIARSDWVLRQVEACDRLSTLFYREWCWDNAQDAVACIKGKYPGRPGPDGDRFRDVDFGPV